MTVKRFIYITIAFIITSMLFHACGASYQQEHVELEWQEENGYRWALLPVEMNGETGFEQIPSSYSRVDMVNHLPDELMNQNRILMNGSGVAAGDIDGDGLPDLYFTRIDGSNRLYRNLGGFQFENITVETLELNGLRSTGALFADINGDGHLDLLVSAVEGENILFLNDGDGGFIRQEESGLQPARGSMTMALADVTGNGYPDLYMVNYRETNVIDEFPVQELTWEHTIVDGELIPPYDDYFTIINRGEGFPPERHEIGRKDELYLNNGDGTFTLADDLEVFRDEAGKPLGLRPDWGLSAKFHDLNRDGLQDLYVSNDFWTPDRIWINQGDGTFRAIDSLAIRNSSYYSMTVDFTDLTKNGYPDIFTVEMLDDDHASRLIKRLPTEPIPLLPGEYHHRPRYNRNSLYLNRGDHTYTEISQYSGLHATEWSWAVRFLDIDLDGHEDVIVVNGFAYDFQNLDSQKSLLNELIRTQGEMRGYIEDFIPLKQQNRIFLNNGDLTFTNMSSELGFNELDISLGLALADLNNDGSLDLVISRLNEEPSIFKNRTKAPRIAVRLIGESPNTQAIGAEVEVLGGPTESQIKQIVSGGDYLSGSDPLLVFAADPDTREHQLRIRWPDGSRSEINSLQPGRMYEIYESEMVKSQPVEESGSRSYIASPASDTLPSSNRSAASGETSLRRGAQMAESVSAPTFEDASHLLEHRHHEDRFNDLTIQPLLPEKLSQQGPGIAFADIDNSGRDALIIGSGKGGSASLFSWDPANQTLQNQSKNVNLLAEGDLTGIASWNREGRSHLIIGQANYEAGSVRTPSAIHLTIENGEVVETENLPGILSASGPVAMADYKGDGSIGLFIGGRFLPGQYPANATSRLFLYDGSGFVIDTENEELFKDLGMVTGAHFVDFNQDGQQDLILTTEWGSIKVFENSNGKFADQTEALGLDSYKGFWQGIAVGDFNNNGYPDLVVTNRGENNSWRSLAGNHPLRIWYGDFNRDRRMDMIVSYYDEAIGEYVPMNKLGYYESMEDILRHAQTNHQFASFSVSDMLRTDADRIPYREVNTFQHMVFLNQKGEGFEAVPLPAKAQFAPAFYAGIADMDNDGMEDIFISQNFFAVTHPQQNPRMDGGRGLWLRGKGDGRFEVLPGHESGVTLYGEQRGAALGDLNQDGKVDLMVSQNAAETRLFLNRTENRGIRIKLEGPEENSSGIGAEIQLVYEDGTHGPKRFISSGSGYWSQNSTTQVLGYSGIPESIYVYWPDGHTQIEKIQNGMMDYVIRYAND